MKRSTIYILTIITIEILLIFILIYWILSPLAKDGGNTKILWIPIFTAAIISLALGYLAGEYILFEKIVRFLRFFIGVILFYAIFIISVILGFGFFHLLSPDLPSNIWVAPSMFVFLASPYIILIGCILGLILCSLKEDLWLLDFGNKTNKLPKSNYFYSNKKSEIFLKISLSLLLIIAHYLE